MAHMTALMSTAIGKSMMSANAANAKHAGSGGFLAKLLDMISSVKVQNNEPTGKLQDFLTRVEQVVSNADKLNPVFFGPVKGRIEIDNDPESGKVNQGELVSFVRHLQHFLTAYVDEADGREETDDVGEDENANLNLYDALYQFLADFKQCLIALRDQLEQQATATGGEERIAFLNEMIARIDAIKAQLDGNQLTTTTTESELVVGSDENTTTDTANILTADNKESEDSVAAIYDKSQDASSGKDNTPLSAQSNGSQQTFLERLLNGTSPAEIKDLGALEKLVTNLTGEHKTQQQTTENTAPALAGAANAATGATGGTVERAEGLFYSDQTRMIESIVKNLTLNTRRGDNQIVMELEPAHMGRLKVDILIRDGVVSGRFLAETSNVKNILMSNMNMLRDSFSERGLQMGSFSVEVGLSFDEKGDFSFEHLNRSLSNAQSEMADFTDEELEPLDLVQIFQYGFHRVNVLI